jgi:hypothetical protein
LGRRAVLGEVGQDHVVPQVEEHAPAALVLDFFGEDGVEAPVAAQAPSAVLDVP